MKESFKNFLFTKHVLVNDKAKYKSLENTFETLFSFANLLGIKIVKGEQLASVKLLKYAQKQLGIRVADPFYKGFPESVRKLSPDQLLFDQLVHYSLTYGFGDFSEPGHSIFREDFERIAFKENAVIKEFSILNEQDAYEELERNINNLFSTTRPVSELQYILIKDFLETYNYKIQECKCKPTAIRLILDTRDLKYVNLLNLSDFVKLVDEMNYRLYNNTKIKHLNLKNQDRKFLSSVLDEMLSGDFYVKDCYEKQKLWCGILHHLHYKPKNQKAEEFLNCMRSGENKSTFSSFEKFMKENNIKSAVDCLKKYKGNAMVIRNLNYLLSRCKTKEDIEYVLNSVETKNNIVLIQNILQYTHYTANNRNFKFTKYNRLKVHIESQKEIHKRQTILSKELCSTICEILKDNLRKNLKNKLGKVYIEDNMKNIAFPLQENTSSLGLNTLPKGSRLPLENGKIIRAFVYWEKVNDIDLSAIGVTLDNKQVEFSWRSMSARQSKGITFSGDQTSGYKGGSEYFDINLKYFRQNFPKSRYLIFNANIYSFYGAGSYKECFCKAGYMIRDEKTTGEVYEPKTVETSFLITCDSPFAHLFAIDLKRNELVWLNIAKDSTSIVAGANNLGYLLDYLDICDVMSLKEFFTMLATEVVGDVNEADVVVSDKTYELKENVKQIKSYNTEDILALLNQ